MKIVFTLVSTLLIGACGGGGVNTTPLGVFNPNPLNNTNTSTSTATFVKVLELSAGTTWAASPKLVFDAAGGLQLVAPAPVQTPAGNAEFMFAKKLAGQDWGKPIQLFVAPIVDASIDLALSVNSSGSAIVGTGFGGTATLKFVGSNGALGVTVTRIISKPLGKFSDLTLLADGSAVYSTVEAKSPIDSALVSRINQVTTAGAVTPSISASEPIKSTESHYFARTAADGTLVHFSDPSSPPATKGVLSSRIVSAPTLTFQPLAKNNNLELYTGFSNSACPNSEIALTRSTSPNNSFAGMMRVLETTGTPAVTACALKYFKSGVTGVTGATLTYPISITTPASVFMSQALGVQPFIHTDASDRGTIVWTKGSGGATGSGTDVSIDLLTISAANVISTPVAVATSSATFGTIVAASVSYSQNSSGTGALAFLVSEPNAAPGVYVAYISKYQPGGNFSIPIRVAPTANSLIYGLAPAVNTAGVAVVAATGSTCTGLTATATGVTCTGTSLRSIYTYQF